MPIQLGPVDAGIYPGSGRILDAIHPRKISATKIGYALQCHNPKMRWQQGERKDTKKAPKNRTNVFGAKPIKTNKYASLGRVTVFVIEKRQIPGFS